MTSRNPHPLRARTIDGSALKAFAHPLRMRLYDQLKDRGPATASMLARATGESTGQTSYHLRQLERHGVVSEVVGRGTARERWWQAEGFSFDVADAATDDATGEDEARITRTTREVIQRQQVHERARRQLEWIERQGQEDREWLEAAVSNELTTRLTPQELLDLAHDLAEVVAGHRERAHAARQEHGDGGTRMIKFYAQMFPLPPEA